MPIRILHCIHALHGGGAERQLTILANYQNANIQFGIFCVNDAISHIDRENCDVLTIKDKSNYPFGMIKEISQAIDKFNPDIVHVWLPPSISTPALIAAKIKKKITVASYRNKKIFESWIRIPEFLSTLFLGDAIVANNPPEQSSYLFRKLFYFKVNVTIPNAVSVPADYIKINTGKVDESLKMVFVGRITQQKNWQTLLLALSQINDTEEWSLQVCGKGEDEQEFIAMSQELNIFHKIEMLGYREDVYSIMNAADLLILPSWYEGMPNVVLEAMMIGLPCIVSDITAHSSLFGNESGVIYFNPNSSKQLTEIISGIIEGSIKLDKHSKTGSVFAEQFMPDIMSKKYQAFYLNLLKEKSYS